MAKNTATNEPTNESTNTSIISTIRRWLTPNKRAKSYAEERKAKVHTHGPKEGKELTPYEAGLRSGYLQCQSDHAGAYKYHEAIKAGKSKEEAKRISREKGKKN